MTRRAKITMFTVLLAFLVCTALIGLTYKSASANGDSDRNALIERIVAYLKGKNVCMKGDRLKAVVNTVCDESQQRDLDYRLALAVIKVESNFKQDVVSKKGASGLFQIKPSLAKYIAKNAGVTWNGSQCLHEPDSNIRLGVYHLSKLVDDFKSLPSALHAYNVGTGKARTQAQGASEPKTAFTKRVLKEYEKNLSVLPDVDELQKTP